MSRYSSCQILFSMSLLIINLLLTSYHKCMEINLSSKNVIFSKRTWFVSYLQYLKFFPVRCVPNSSLEFSWAFIGHFFPFKQYNLSFETSSNPKPIILYSIFQAPPKLMLCCEAGLLQTETSS